MKNFIRLFIVLTIFFAGCKTEQKGYICNNGTCQIGDNPQFLTYADCQASGCGKSSAGYNCSNGTCVSVSSGAQYATLATCQSACSTSTAGYNCNGTSCYSVSSGAVYPTLSQCQSACGGQNTGTVEIKATWTWIYLSCWNAYSVTIGLGYTSNDIANDAFFATSQLSTVSPIDYSNNTLSPGTYYYKAKKTFNSSICGNGGNGNPPDVVKNGAFTIVAGQTTNVNVGSLD